MAILRFVLINRTNQSIQASVCGTIENFIGWDGDAGKAIHNFNEFRSKTGWPVRGLFMQSTGVDPKSPAWGTMALTTTSENTTHRTAWADLGWGNTLLDFWDDFSDDGRLEPREGKRDAPFGSLAASTIVPAATDAPPGLREFRRSIHPSPPPARSENVPITFPPSIRITNRTPAGWWNFKEKAYPSASKSAKRLGTSRTSWAAGASSSSS